MKWQHTAKVMARNYEQLLHKFHDNQEPDPLTDTLVFVKDALNFARCQFGHLEADSREAAIFANKYKLTACQEVDHYFFLEEEHRLVGQDYYTEGKPWYRYREGHIDPIEGSIFGRNVT